ncbi:hypothetical protein [Paraburkholderia fungorum]|uniref:hypothetical protein n=1 Tax=Paraburkholderia fungorum TaxID=134537 RepID=UPI0038B6C052
MSAAIDAILGMNVGWINSRQVTTQLFLRYQTPSPFDSTETFPGAKPADFD